MKLCLGRAVSCSLDTPKKFLWENRTRRGDTPVVYAGWSIQVSDFVTARKEVVNIAPILLNFHTKKIDGTLIWRRKFESSIEDIWNKDIGLENESNLDFFCSLKSPEHESGIVNAPWIEPFLASFGAGFSRERRLRSRMGSG